MFIFKVHVDKKAPRRWHDTADDVDSAMFTRLVLAASPHECGDSGSPVPPGGVHIQFCLSESDSAMAGDSPLALPGANSAIAVGDSHGPFNCPAPLGQADDSMGGPFSRPVLRPLHRKHRRCGSSDAVLPPAVGNDDEGAAWRCCTPAAGTPTTRPRLSSVDSSTVDMEPLGTPLSPGSSAPVPAVEQWSGGSGSGCVTTPRYSTTTHPPSPRLAFDFSPPAAGRGAPAAASRAAASLPLVLLRFCAPGGVGAAGTNPPSWSFTSHLPSSGT